MESPALHNRDWESLRLGFERGIVDRGFLFIGHLDQWLAFGSFREAHELLRRRMPRVFLSVLSMRGCT